MDSRKGRTSTNTASKLRRKQTEFSKSPRLFKSAKPYLEPKHESDFTKLKDSLGANNNFLHKVSKAKKALPPVLDSVPDEYIPQRYKNIWYFKSDSSRNCLDEVIAQELFRLIIPNQPKTRIVLSQINNTLNVVSKEIPGFTQFRNIRSATLKQKLLDGQYFGLGYILVTCLWLAESDLQRANIGVSDSGQVHKIDGGWCFSDGCVVDNKKLHLPITEKDINSLPIVSDFEASNWLGVISYRGDVSITFRNNDFSDHAAIRKEINEAMMRILILPTAILSKIIDDCLPQNLQFVKNVADNKSKNKSKSLVDVNEQKEMCHKETLKRHANLKRVAIENKSFQQYMSSAQAEQDLETYINYLKTFKTIGKRNLNMNDHESMVREQFAELRKKIISLNYTPQRIFKAEREPTRIQPLRKNIAKL